MAKPDQTQLNLANNTTPDANGWVKKDFGNFQMYERTVSVSGVAVPANNNAVISSSLSLPVGIANSSLVRMYCTWFGGFGGRIYASVDNGNTTGNVTTFSVQLGNSQTAGITASGYIYIMCITV